MEQDTVIQMRATQVHQPSITRVLSVIKTYWRVRQTAITFAVHHIITSCISMMAQLSVPPGFRFHPTEEELLYYYLRKKVSYEAIDLDVVREVDLNKLEPWDLKEKCKIGSGPQNEWYFFSHKDKKYPTGTRTNRATTAGFWKATGRDKAIHLSDSTRIGMRKTLVFYIGRAPHGQKTDWIMHEYRLDDDNSEPVQEDGWVVCRVFKKKNQSGLLPEVSQYHHEDDHEHFGPAAGTSLPLDREPKCSQMMAMAHQQRLAFYGYDEDYANTNPNSLDAASMHLPRLLSPETGHHHQAASSSFSQNLTCVDSECSQNLLMRLTSSAGDLPHHAAGDWSFLDKLLALNPPVSQNKTHSLISSLQLAGDMSTSTAQKLSWSYSAGENGPLRFSK